MDVEETLADLPQEERSEAGMVNTTENARVYEIEPQPELSEHELSAIYGIGHRLLRRMGAGLKAPTIVD